jgi:hypothetical protein
MNLPTFIQATFLEHDNEVLTQGFEMVLAA